MYLKYCCMYGKQCRPWSDAAFCGVWSWSTQFAKAYLSQYVGLLRYWQSTNRLEIWLRSAMYAASQLVPGRGPTDVDVDTVLTHFLIRNPMNMMMRLIFIAPACSRVRYRRPIFCPSVRLSTFMLTFDIYVKVSILINYKTKQPSNLAWNISLTSWLCNIGVRFFVCLSIGPSVCQHLCRSSTFMSKLVF